MLGLKIGHQHRENTFQGSFIPRPESSFLQRAIQNSPSLSKPVLLLQGHAWNLDVLTYASTRKKENDNLFPSLTFLQQITFLANHF